MAFFPRVWINALIPPVRRIERTVLDAWLRDADPSIASIVFEQSRLCNLVQRLSDGREVNFYYIRAGLILGEFPRQLPVTAPELLLGEVELEAEGKTLRAKLYAVNGRFFSIVFDRVPPRLTTKSTIYIIRVKIAGDAGTVESAPTLPEDYEAVIAHISGADHSKLAAVLLPRDQLYQVHTELNDYWVIADIPDKGVLAVRSDRDDGLVFFLSYEGDAPVPLATSLASAASHF